MSQQKGRDQSRRLPQGGEDAQERLVSVKTIKATSGQRSRQKTGGPRRWGCAVGREQAWRVLTGLYVCRSQLPSGSEVDPDELPLWVDQTE